MSAKEKTKPGAPRQDHLKDIDRQKEIERLEKDVEDLRQLAGDEKADAEFERVSKQVAELRREFYAHLGPWQRAQIARHQNRPSLGRESIVPGLHHKRLRVDHLARHAQGQLVGQRLTVRQVIGSKIAGKGAARRQF